MAGLPQVLEFISALKKVPWERVNRADLQKWIDDPQRLAIELLKFFENFPQAETVETQAPVKPILRRLYGDQVITISARDGSRCIGEQTAMSVKDGIDHDFGNWGLNNRSHFTDGTNVCIHEMVRNATFAQMFGSLGFDIDKFCFTQDQILGFCEENHSKLRQDGYATFFLFKEGDQFFVARVGVRSDGLHVHVRRFEFGGVWDAGDAHRVVTPQLKL